MGDFQVAAAGERRRGGARARVVLTEQDCPDNAGGMFESRCLEDLNKASGRRTTRSILYENRFYWEWWYFDAHFDDATAASSSCRPRTSSTCSPMSARCCSTSTPGRVEHNNIVPFPGSQWRSSTETCDVASATTPSRLLPRVQREVQTRQPGVRPEVREPAAGLDARYRRDNVRPGGEAPAVRLGGSAAEGEGDRHHQRRRSRTRGYRLGYHDHNWGSGALPMYVSHWIWGRLSTDRVTMIFADITTTKSVAASGCRWSSWRSTTR